MTQAVVAPVGCGHCLAFIGPTDISGLRIVPVGEASEKSAARETPRRGSKTSAQGKRSGALGILPTHILTP